MLKDSDDEMRWISCPGSPKLNAALVNKKEDFKERNRYRLHMQHIILLQKISYQLKISK